MSYTTTYPWIAPAARPPRMIAEAVPLLGLRETPGAASNPVILGWANELGLAGYRVDETPWCGLFAALLAARAGKAPPAQPLWALNWAKFGNPAPDPALGDVLVFRRPSGGHVGLYVAEDGGAYHVLGGNQGDRVCILRIARSRLYRARRPAYGMQPATVMRHIVGASRAALSTDEA